MYLKVCACALINTYYKGEKQGTSFLEIKQSPMTIKQCSRNLV